METREFSFICQGASVCFVSQSEEIFALVSLDEKLFDLPLMLLDKCLQNQAHMEQRGHK